MANVRNYEEYRAEVLDRLGDDYTVEDLRNTERWRLRVLDMLSGGSGGGGGSSDLTWILPEQTVTLVDQPVEITGLRLDLIPSNTLSVPLKYTSSELGGAPKAHYEALIYLNDALNNDANTISIFSQDGADYIVIGDGESISANTYTISIGLF